MADGCDMYGGMTRALLGREGAWAFVRDFTACWGRPLAPGDGWDEAEIDAAERRLGVRLPTALREAYGLFGRRDDLTRNHDTLLPLKELYVDDDGGVLVYQVENQGCAYWGVLLKDLEQDDPPTVTRLDGPGAKWEPWEPRLSTACVAMVMSEVVLLDDGPTDYVELEVGTDLGREFRRLPDVGRETRWFTCPDVLIREIAGEFVNVRARTEAALDAVREAVPGDWLEG
ncbi:SMI1/KNR4 family protein [Streptomyces sp. NPDC058335]|uniref:SMI1/KNR4 family protein n=1 Tax=Streptomyces sp. NPDC058335 TaxID=3346451 RepID=UPI00364D5AC1